MNEASDLIFSIALSVMSDSLFLNFQLKNQYECNIKSEKDIKKPLSVVSCKSGRRTRPFYIFETRHTVDYFNMSLIMSWSDVENIRNHYYNFRCEIE